MSELVVTLLRLAFLALLWIFIIFTVITVKNDVYGTRVSQRTPQRSVRSVLPAREEAPSKPWALVVTGGPLAGTRIPLNSAAVTVGRSPDSALVLDDGFASARHARFYNDGTAWVVEDLNSTNGTWVANTRIDQPTRIQEGVPVVIGRTTVELRR